MIDRFLRAWRKVVMVVTVSCYPVGEKVVGEALPVASLDRSAPVSFEQEILPVLQANCLACHNATKAKAGLNLETPSLIRRGGDSGASVIAGDPERSLLFVAASHKDEDVIMPPVGNKSNARPLTPKELALLALWIRQGAEGEVTERKSLDWLPLSDRLRPIYATAFTETGRFVAFGRGSEAIVHELISEGSRSWMIDPELTGKRAHRDSVNAIAISANGDLVATGGFREVKLWQRSLMGESFAFFPADDSDPPVFSLSSDRLFAAFGYQTRIIVREMSTGLTIFQQQTDPISVRGVTLTLRNDAVLVLTTEKEALVFEFEPRRVMPVALPEEPVSSFRFGKGFALTFRDGTVGTLSRQVGATWKVEQISGLAGKVTIATDAGGEALVIADAVGDVWLMDAKGRSPRKLLQRQQTPGALAVDLELDLVLVDSGGGRVEVCGIETGKPVFELHGARPERRKVSMLERELSLRRGNLKLAKTTLEQNQKKASQSVERLKEAKNAYAEKESEFQEAERRMSKANTEVAETEQERKLVDETLEQKVAQLNAARGALNEAKRKLEITVRKAPSSKSATDELSEALNVVESHAIRFGKLEVELSELRKATKGKRAALDERLKTAKDTVKEAIEETQGTRMALSLAKVELELSENASRESGRLVKESRDKIEFLENVLGESNTRLADAQAALAEARMPFVSLFFGEAGKRIIGMERNGAINVWAASDGAELDYIPGGANSPFKVYPLTDNTLARIDTVGSCSLIHLDADWRMVKRFGADAGLADRVMALEFSPDENLLAVGGGDPSRSGDIAIWDVASHERVHDFPSLHSDVVFALKFSPDGKQLASGGADRFARVIDLESGRVKHHLEGHTHYVMDVDWTADGRLLASAGADGVAKLWDTVSGERTKNIEGFDKELTGVGFIGAGNEVLVSSGDKTMMLYGSDGKRLRALDRGAEFLLNAAISRNGRWAAAGSHSGVLTLWEVSSGNIFRQIR